MRNKYFEQKDVAMEISIVINKAIETNFTFHEYSKPDSKMVFSSFNQLVIKMKRLIEQYEEEFLIKT